MGSLGVSGDPRADKADLTNASHLFGDPFGDIDDDMYGDADDDIYGDINDETLSAFNVISGDVDDGYDDMDDEEVGGIMGRRGSRRRRRIGTGLALAGGAAGGALAGRAIRRKLQKRRGNKKLLQAQLRRQRSKQTLYSQRNARRNMGKINRDQPIPFFEVTGAKLNSSPIDPLSVFVADMFKYNLDRQAADTPFYQETAQGVFAGGIWTQTATGVVTNRFYTALILQLGINKLNAAPGTIFTVTGTFPTINGTLTVATTPWIFTIQNNFDVRFKIFPWQLVSNKPFPILGAYDNANPIIVAVTGLPAASAVSLVVPGSLHPWTVAMRNALMR
jgi:hypothetical protein